MRRPIRQAYSDTGALAVHCPNCGADVGKWCSTDEGQLRKVPCVARAAAGSVVIGPPGNRDPYRDFSEPIHGRAQ